MGLPNRGEGGGGPRLGKNSHIFPLFFFGNVPKHSSVVFLAQWRSEISYPIHIYKWRFPPRCWKHRNPFLGSRPLQVGRSGCLEEAVEDLWAGEHWTSPVPFVLLPFFFSLLYSLLLNPDSYALTGGGWRRKRRCWRKRREPGWRLAAPCCHA